VWEQDYRHLMVNQLGRKRWQLIISTFSPTILDRYVLSLDVAAFAQALAERAQRLGEHVRRPRADKADYWYRRPLRVHDERPRDRRSTERGYELPSSDAKA
jgi:hypothetical protein